MIDGIIGKKLGMTRIYRDNGRQEAVTAIEAGPCIVTQVKTAAKEGYSAAQFGFGLAKRLNSAERGHLKDLGQFRHLREVRLADAESLKVGDRIDVSQFKVGDRVDISGISKGKGFAGVVKRHHFKGGKATHGQSDRTRHPGAIGATTSPGRVLKNLRMAGHMGTQQVTVCDLEVMLADPERNLLVVSGAVPGAAQGLLMIKKSRKRK
ncbi:MAG: 50S ribosomal protein L3 [Chloroflexi bacterium]|nr:50S ribosomal protein L3 [Chloroflexota bacterium]